MGRRGSTRSGRFRKRRVQGNPHSKPVADDPVKDPHRVTTDHVSKANTVQSRALFHETAINRKINKPIRLFLLRPHLFSLRPPPRQMGLWEATVRVPTRKGKFTGP